MNYLDILKSDYYKKTYSKVAELKKDFAVDHAFIHIENVLNNAKQLAKLVNLTQKQTDLLLIAVCLHDIGYIKGRDDHAQNGAILAKEYLQTINFDSKDIDIVCNAIKNHGGKRLDDYKDDISFCLILADKLDFISTRYHLDILEERHKFYLHIYKTEFVLQDNKFCLNVYSNTIIDEDKKNNYFFTKLRAVLEFVSQIKNKKVDLNFIVK